MQVELVNDGPVDLFYLTPRIDEGIARLLKVSGLRPSKIVCFFLEKIDIYKVFISNFLINQMLAPLKVL